jgi:hypothetical protein
MSAPQSAVTARNERINRRLHERVPVDCQVRLCWQETPGVGSEILYSLAGAAVTGQNPEIPTPIEEGTLGIPTAPVEVGA